ncbi:MAG: hypothetical protein ACOYYJ_05370 [Chloroflexota bacterium]
MLLRFLRALDVFIYLLIGVALLTASGPIAGEPVERARAYTRPIEFDYVRWSAEAALLKLQAMSGGLPYYLQREDRLDVVMQYLFVTERLLGAEDALARLYADPAIADKESASAHLRAERARLDQRQRALAPLAEAVLQEQVAAALAEAGLTLGGQPLPPVLYHSSAVPMGLVISPRERIEQLTNISLQPALPVDRQDALESQVDAALDVSSLVVPMGGVGVYPTMVMRTTNLPWLLDTIAHEWTHNYLTLRPLGFLYDATPELRTMNETTASIVGGEIGTLILQRDYADLYGRPLRSPLVSAPPLASPPGLQIASASQPSLLPLPSAASDPPPFDFRAEMHETRVTVDALLAEGKIEAAEAYMEERRQVFWQNGYAVRKLNQAYFAFYGAYADAPGGAAGEDPVGPAVRALRAQSASLAEFVNRISWMTSFEQLQAAID